MKYIFFILLLSSCSTVGNRYEALFNANDPEKIKAKREKEHAEVVATLVSTKYLGENMDSEFDKYSASFCTDPVIKIEQCRDNYVEMVTAKISLKYPKANWDQVNLYCKAEPEICKTSQNRELLVKQSHDLIVKHQRAQERARQWQAFAEGMRQYQQNNRTISCTSYNVGNTTQTNCN